MIFRLDSTGYDVHIRSIGVNLTDGRKTQVHTLAAVERSRSQQAEKGTCRYVG